mmetsp:Transcript_11983/g.38354  ORF Transcript_11983/g.38354 Transcript_11983/m.38354 type:complete len:374 (-) Transcript_11983:196-1317(-)
MQGDELDDARRPVVQLLVQEHETVLVHRGPDLPVIPVEGHLEHWRAVTPLRRVGRRRRDPGQGQRAHGTGQSARGALRHAPRGGANAPTHNSLLLLPLVQHGLPLLVVDGKGGRGVLRSEADDEEERLEKRPAVRVVAGLELLDLERGRRPALFLLLGHWRLVFDGPKERPGDLAVHLAVLGPPLEAHEPGRAVRGEHAVLQVHGAHVSAQLVQVHLVDELELAARGVFVDREQAWGREQRGALELDGENETLFVWFACFALDHHVTPSDLAVDLVVETVLDLKRDLLVERDSNATDDILVEHGTELVRDVCFLGQLADHIVALGVLEKARVDLRAPYAEVAVVRCLDVPERDRGRGIGGVLPGDHLLPGLSL